MTNSIVYSKERIITFHLTRVKIKDIPVLVPENLTFYQKYIVLLLSKGIIAQDKRNLISILSTVLNIKEVFISDFIHTLWNLSYIEYKPDNCVFSLAENYKILIDAKDNSIMLGNIANSTITVDNLYYFDELDNFVNSAYFDKINVNLKSLAVDATSQDIRKISTKLKIDNNKAIIKKIILEELKNDGRIPGTSFRFLFDEIIGRYSFNVNCSFLYEYENGKSLLKEMFPHTNLPAEIYEKKKIEYQYDNELPRFISLDNTHYNKIFQNDSNIEVKLKDIRGEEAKQENLQSVIETVLAKLNTIEQKKELWPSQYYELDDEYYEMVNLKKELALQKDKLSLVTKELDRNRIMLQETIEQNNNFMKDIIEFDSRIASQKSDLVKNLNMSDPKIKEVIHKFQNSNFNVLFIDKVNCICASIDQALNASEHNAFSKLENIMQTIKDINKQTLKIIFDVLFDNESKTLNDYFRSGRFITNLETIKSKNIDDSTFYYLKQFHEISNAYGHLYDEFYKGPINNREKVNGFQKMEISERRKILISPINLLCKIELSDKEITSIERKFLGK